MQELGDLNGIEAALLRSWSPTIHRARPLGRAEVESQSSDTAGDVSPHIAAGWGSRFRWCIVEFRAANVADGTIALSSRSTAFSNSRIHAMECARMTGDAHTGGGYGQLR